MSNLYKEKYMGQHLDCKRRNAIQYFKVHNAQYSHEAMLFLSVSPSLTLFTFQANQCKSAVEFLAMLVYVLKCSKASINSLTTACHRFILILFY